MRLPWNKRLVQDEPGLHRIIHRPSQNNACWLDFCPTWSRLAPGFSSCTHTHLTAHRDTHTHQLAPQLLSLSLLCWLISSIFYRINATHPRLLSPPVLLLISRSATCGLYGSSVLPRCWSVCVRFTRFKFCSIFAATAWWSTTSSLLLIMSFGWSCDPALCHHIYSMGLEQNSSEVILLVLELNEILKLICFFYPLHRPLMIVTQKITTLAFQLHDGEAEEFACTYTHSAFNSKGSIRNSRTLKLKQLHVLFFRYV